MKKSVLFLATMMLLLTNGALLNAQVTVGANRVPNATLEVVHENGNATHAGVIAPNVDRSYLNGDHYTSTQTGAIVYVKTLDGAASGQAKNIKSAGYYYFDGAVWQGFGGSAPLNITSEITSSYTVQVTDDVVLLNITTGGQRLTLPGEAENTPIGKMIYFSNKGTQDMQLADLSQLRNDGYFGVRMWSDCTFMYIGGNKWISLSSY